MGKGIREFKKNINDATREVTSETSVDNSNRLTQGDIERQRTVEETERTPKRLM
jgi:Sec-independent protein translocase protein TatA